MNIQNVLLWRLECKHGDVNGIVNAAQFHSTPHINQTLPQIIHILHFCPVHSLVIYAPEFCSQLDYGCVAATHLVYECTASLGSCT